MDVWGLHRVWSISPGGKWQYFVSFIDDLTKAGWVTLLESKSGEAITGALWDWQRQRERESGCQVVQIRSDNARELAQGVFGEYLKEQGIIHETTVSYSPEQNGIAERFNRTVVDKGRTLIAASNLPASFWTEAIKTAVYLRNRELTTNRSGLTPYEAWRNRRPNLAHLRAFGCRAWAHIPAEIRQPLPGGKLQKRSWRCVLVGYEKSAYQY